jgi:hypothetical protein
MREEAPSSKLKKAPEDRFQTSGSEDEFLELMV